MRRFQLLIGIFLAGLFALPAAAAAPQPCSLLERQMSRDKIPGLAIAVFHEGVPTLSYCGAANVKDRVPVTASTVFEAASLSKPVFAYAVITLVKQHKFSLDKPLVEYLGGSYIHRQHPFTALTNTDGPVDVLTDKRLSKITARMVLAHISGLPNWSRNQPLKLISTPGAEFHYSSEGYVMLQRAVEAATHEDLEQVVQQAVFAPLGMSHSTFAPAAEAEMAQGYGPRGLPEPSSVQAPLASSSLRTTLPDYTKFLEALILLPQDVSPFGTMRLAQSVADERRHIAWGAGLGLEDIHDRLTIFHGGSNPGFRSFFALEPETGNGVLYFSNSDNGDELLDSVVEHYVPGRHTLTELPMLHPKD